MCTLSEAKVFALPNEILEKIFLLLPQSHVQKNVALVCKRFLDVTRQTNFVPSLKVNLVPALDSPNSIYKPDEFDRIQKCLKNYPNCKLVVCYTERKKDYASKSELNTKNQHMHFFMRSLIPFAPSMKTLVLNLIREHAFAEFCEELARKEVSFETLKTIVFVFESYRTIWGTVDNDLFTWDQSVSLIQEAGPEFWGNFPNLTTVLVDFKPLVVAKKISMVNFINDVSSKCLKIENFYYNSNIEIKWSYDSFCSQNNEVQSIYNVKKFQVIMSCANVDQQDLLLNQKNLRKYFEIKFPNVKDCVDNDMTSKNGNIFYYGNHRIQKPGWFAQKMFSFRDWLFGV